MAYYTSDNFDIIATRQGIKIIHDYLLSHKEEVLIEIRHIGTTDEVILIQTLVGNKRDAYSNTVSLTPHRKEIMINPISFNGVNATKEVLEFINSIPSILRDKKLDYIIDEF